MDLSQPMPWKTLEQGTSTTLVAALDPALKGKYISLHSVHLLLPNSQPPLNNTNTPSAHSGTFLSDCQIFKTADYTTNPQYAEKLWTLSEKIVGEKFEF